MPTTRFVPAWSKKTGEKHRIPARWLDHPTLGKPFTTTEPTGTADAAPVDGAPDELPADAEPAPAPTTTKATARAAAPATTGAAAPKEK